MAFIRPYEPKDAEDCKHICRATLPPSLLSSPSAIKISPYLWTLQFTFLSPSTCFVLDDGTGKVVGYVIGCPDVFKFAEEYPTYIKEVLQSPEGLRDVPPPKQLSTLESWTLQETGQVNTESLSQVAYKVDWLILDGVEGKRELVESYRAMMHIDLLEPWQGKGWGRKMIERFVESVQESKGVDKGKGIQIGVAGENTKVVKFYEKVGFRIYPGGEKEGNVWMVRDM
ncbi:acyl-CoA N-acyltransferase [Podospora fimiseda]|uniref:Acyl-CoA N-acyltransferase n=1 Tax=Podospora fimiseda TaxID=252190 RepID=A0AAN7BLZ9_9PEZI|nr:acyl-CoA N-acyltransferase [Podospora fimiseda]